MLRFKRLRFKECEPTVLGIHSFSASSVSNCWKTSMYLVARFLHGLGTSFSWIERTTNERNSLMNRFFVLKKRIGKTSHDWMMRVSSVPSVDVYDVSAGFYFLREPFLDWLPLLLSSFLQFCQLFVLRVKRKAFSFSFVVRYVLRIFPGLKMDSMIKKREKYDK